MKEEMNIFEWIAHFYTDHTRGAIVLTIIVLIIIGLYVADEISIYREMKRTNKSRFSVKFARKCRDFAGNPSRFPSKRGCF